MKSLYITFATLTEGYGITKKIVAQHRAFIKCGMDMEFAHSKIIDGVKYYKIGSDEICLGGRFVAKICENRRYDFLYRYILTHNVEFVYLRYTSEASPLYLLFLWRVKKLGAKIFLEIPTYPYDGEDVSRNLYEKICTLHERVFRTQLRAVVDRVVTYSTDNYIFDIECINISNAIDFDTIELRSSPPIHNYIKFLAVATLSYWHGYDRFLYALRDYYKLNPDGAIIKFDIVGDGMVYEELKQLTNALSLEQYVTLYGRLEGEELTEVFKDADICVGSLARHRSGVYKMKALKCVEYAARGVPFIYSESNSDFDNQPYIYRVSSDEKPIDIKNILSELKYREYRAEDIRKSVSQLSWRVQMQRVIDYIVD